MTIPDNLQVLQPVVLRHHTTGSVLATARLSLLDGGAWASLVTEASLLARVLYKSKNQHRASKHLKKLQQLHRSVQLLLELQLPLICEQLDTLSNAAAARVTHSRPNAAVAAQLPSRAAACFVLHRLAAALSLIKALQTHCTQAAASLSVLLAHTYFLPLALVAVAIVARVRVLAALLVTDIVAVYNALIEVAPALPSNPSHTVAHTALPAMFKCVWAQDMPIAQAVPFDQGDSLEMRAPAAAARLGVLPCTQVMGGVAEVADLAMADMDLGEALPRASLSVMQQHRRTPAVVAFEDRGVDRALEGQAGVAVAERAQHASPPEAAPAAEQPRIESHMTNTSDVPRRCTATLLTGKKRRKESAGVAFVGLGTPVATSVPAQRKVDQGAAPPLQRKDGGESSKQRLEEKKQKPSVDDIFAQLLG